MSMDVLIKLYPCLVARSEKLAISKSSSFAPLYYLQPKNIYIKLYLVCFSITNFGFLCLVGTHVRYSHSKGFSTQHPSKWQTTKRRIISNPYPEIETNTLVNHHLHTSKYILKIMVQLNIYIASFQYFCMKHHPLNQ